jgi:hypothetical protein
MLPNFALIGAGKCGTTSLQHYLAQHPDVHMSTPKEPQFFTRADWRETLGEYEQLFDSPKPIRGEASMDYTKWPRWQGIPERMREALGPDVKFAYLVGDPVKRVVSHYVQSYSILLEHRTFESALRDYDQPGNPYVAPSRYATQLDQFLEHFPRENVLVIDQDDLRHRQADALREIFTFLGVDPDAQLTGLDAQLNVGAEKTEMGPRGGRLWHGALAPAVRRLPDPVRGPVERRVVELLSRPIDRPSLNNGLEGELAELLRPEAERLRELTGKPFAGWSV